MNKHVINRAESQRRINILRTIAVIIAFISVYFFFLKLVLF
ncbi:MAG: hypothetical protein K0Q79_1624 [Flavipsychrobacter sp.]|jgi:hypothetical protein|nr:hypothetical protein [Flavipsychrobacter sp.]